MQWLTERISLKSQVQIHNTHLVAKNNEKINRFLFLKLTSGKTLNFILFGNERRFCCINSSNNGIILNVQHQCFNQYPSSILFKPVVRVNQSMLESILVWCFYNVHTLDKRKKSSVRIDHMNVQRCFYMVHRTLREWVLEYSR